MKWTEKCKTLVTQPMKKETEVTLVDQAIFCFRVGILRWKPKNSPTVYHITNVI
jgi:hypothetical protein